MNKYHSFYRYIAVFMCAITLFLSFPFNSIRVVRASGNTWDNFIDFIRTNIGSVSVSNGTLSGTDRGSFYASLYSTSLVWQVNGNHFTFIPSSIFSKSEWVACCNAGGSDIDSRFNDFNIQECLILSDYVTDTGSGYHLQNFPSLSDTSDFQSPLVGYDVYYNFDFHLDNSGITNESIYNTAFNDIRSSYTSSDNYFIVSGWSMRDNYTNFFVSNFIGFDNSIDYIYVNRVSSYGGYYYMYYVHDENGFHSMSYPYCTWLVGGLNKNIFYNNRNQNLPFICHYFSNPNRIPSITTSSADISNFLFLQNPSFVCSMPVVFVDSGSGYSGENFYYWLKGSPSGDYYTSSNITNNIYSYDYVNNNNWQEVYNNYITDVSNYYSTTENITNEQLSEYIDHSTTINNITNNYITNNNGGSGDDIITNSWLERIYQEVVKIKNILLGRYRHDDSGDTYITDNSVKNEIFNFPTDEIFPDLDPEDMVQPSDFLPGIPWDLLKAKLAGLIREVIPFCYIFFIGSVFEALVAPPSPPYFEIPFVIESFNISETVIIDMSDSAWEIPHRIWIALIMILFVIFLFELSRKVIMLFTNMFN